MTSEFLDQLNPEQREAAETVDGPLLVLAGAGTGKTRVITFRIAHMISQGISPDSILGMTFTNKAAREMRERIAQLLPGDTAEKVTLGTFHSFCCRILRKEIRALKYTPNFTIADDADQKAILRQAAAELGYSKESAPAEVMSVIIGRWKNNLTLPKDAGKDPDLNETEAVAARIYRRYQQILENQNMLDFDDLLMFVWRIWTKKPEVLEKYRDIYRYILVDEYQDTNMSQFELIRMLAGDKANLCVVGDDDQSIYGWRGAVVENILNFPDYFPGTKVTKLERNYRSTNKILETANRIISGNSARYDKNLWSACGEGENLRLIRLESAEDEAKFISDAIYEIMNFEMDMLYSDIAILYRSNHQSRLIEQALRKASIPYRVVGGQEFFQRKEIRDAAAYLKLIVNPKEDQSFLRIIGSPPRGIGDKAIANLKDLQSATRMSFTELIASSDSLDMLNGPASAAAKNFNETMVRYRKEFSKPGGLTKKVADFLKDIGFLEGFQRMYRNYQEAEKRRDNVYEFIHAVDNFEKNFPREAYLLEFLESFALLDENDKTQEEADNENTVTLTTVHAAKGLEFPCVFLVGMEHGLFPHERSEKEGGIEEERRLFYVAVTRAKLRLVMSYAGRRMRYGKLSPQRPSVFISELPEEYVEKQGVDDYFQEASDDDLESGFADIFRILNEDV